MSIPIRSKQSYVECEYCTVMGFEPVDLFFLAVAILRVTQRRSIFCQSKSNIHRIAFLCNHTSCHRYLMWSFKNLWISHLTHSRVHSHSTLASHIVMHLTELSHSHIHIISRSHTNSLTLTHARTRSLMNDVCVTPIFQFVRCISWPWACSLLHTTPTPQQHHNTNTALSSISKDKQVTNFVYTKALKPYIEMDIVVVMLLDIILFWPRRCGFVSLRHNDIISILRSHSIKRVFWCQLNQIVHWNLGPS